MHMRGYPKSVRAKDDAYDAELAAKLWAVSEELTGVRYEWTQAAQPEGAG